MTAKRRGEVGLLPRSLQPRWRTIPALGWTVARGMTPPTWPSAVGLLWAACSYPFLMLQLAAARGAGRVVALNRRAMLQVADRKASSLPHMVSAFGAVLMMTPLVLAAGSAGVAAGLSTGVAFGVSYLALIGAPMMPYLAAIPRTWRREGSIRQTAPQVGAHEHVLTASMFFAHPRGRGHGGALLDAALRELPADAALLITGANPQLRRVYARAAVRAGLLTGDPAHETIVARRPAGNAATEPRTGTPPRSIAPRRDDTVVSSRRPSSNPTVTKVPAPGPAQPSARPTVDPRRRPR